MPGSSVGAPGGPVDPAKMQKMQEMLILQYKNAGKELRPKGDPELVNGHDFPDKEWGKASP